MDRICKRCKELKPLNAVNFPPEKTSKGGFRNICRLCYREKQRDGWAQRKLIPEVIAKVREQRTIYDSRRYRLDEHVLKRGSRSLLAYAVKMGKIKRLPCEVCQTLPSEAHHDDYTKPLKVRWFCKKHHLEHHNKLRYKSTIK